MKQVRATMPQWATLMIEGRLHLHERHVDPNTPGLSAAIRGAGKLVPGEVGSNGVEAVGWVDPAHFVGKQIWITRAAAGRMLGVEVDWIDRLTEARLVRHLRDGRGELWLKLDPAWSVRHFEKIFNDTLQKPNTLADFDAYTIGRGLFGYDSETPHPDIVLEGVVDFLTGLGVFGSMEVRGLITLPVDSENGLMRDLWSRYLKRLRNFPVTKSSLDLETFRMLLPAAIANAPGTCWDEEVPDDRPAPPPQILARLARLQRVRDECSLYMLMLAGRGVVTPYLVQTALSCAVLDDLLVATDTDPRDPEAMTRLIEAFAFGDDDETGPNRARRYFHARNILLMAQQLSAVAARSPTNDGQSLRPFAIAEPHGLRDIRRRISEIGKEVKNLGMQNRKLKSDALADGFQHVLAAARRRCDQVADVTDDALIEAAGLEASEADYQDVETLSWVLNEDGTYGSGQQIIHVRVWKADRLWMRLHDKGLLTKENHARRQVRTGMESGQPFEKGMRYYQYRGVTPVGGATAQTPWFATLFQDAAPLAPSNLPLDTRERRADIIKRWQLPGYRTVKSGLLSFRESSHVYRMAALDGIVLMPLEEFDHAMRAAHLAFRAGMIVGCRINETLQMANKASDWPVLEVGTTARTGWLAVPKQSRDEGRIGERRKPRFFMVDDDTFRYFTEMAGVVIRRQGKAISEMEPSPRLRWKVGAKPYVFSLDGLPLSSDDLNTCLRYLLAGVATCTLHDARHAAANRGWLEGEEVADTMLRLGHASEDISDYYRSATASQADIAAARSIDRRTRDESLRYWESLFA